MLDGPNITAAPKGAASDQRVRVERRAGRDAFLAFEAEWRVLFEATAEATPFQSWEWLSTWWKYRGRGDPEVLVAFVGDQPLCAMALMLNAYRGTPLRILKWIGAPNSDYHDFVGGERRNECAMAFVDYLQSRRDWHVCDLAELRGETLTGLSAALGAGPCDWTSCATIILPPTADQYWSKFKRNHSVMRRRQRQLNADYNSVEFTTVKTSAELPDAMDDLFRVHTGRMKQLGKVGAFATESARAFHREIAAKFLARGWLILHRLMIDGECRAVVYCFKNNATIYYYLSGFDIEFSRYSPSGLLMRYAIETAIAEGIREFDFMRGEESYKERWKTVPRANGRLVFGRKTMTSRLVVASHLLERRIYAFLESVKSRSRRC